MLGGETIPHTHGLVGHSDADVLLHAIIDALLGAVASRDIGHHFPCIDELKNANSLSLLSKTVDIVEEAGYQYHRYRLYTYNAAPEGFQDT